MLQFQKILFLQINLDQNVKLLKSGFSGKCEVSRKAPGSGRPILHQKIIYCIIEKNVIG